METSQVLRRGTNAAAVLWMGVVVVDLGFPLGLLNDWTEAE